MSSLSASVDFKTVRSVTSQLICVCGCSNMVVAGCECGKAAEMTTEAEELFNSGLDTQQVLASFEEKHGSWVLAAPKAEGFNLFAWILPLVGVGVGTIIVVSVLRSLKSGESDEPGPAEEELSPVDEKYRDLLEEELRA